MPWTFYNSSGQRLQTSDGIPSQAVQSDIEDETNEDTYIPPDLIKHSPGVAKALAGVESDGTALSGNYNISGTSSPATGKYTVTLLADMSSTGYQVVSQVFEGHDTSNPRKVKVHSLATGSFTLRAFTEGTALVTVATFSAVFGAQ